jgi:hypothetical protein
MIEEARRGHEETEESERLRREESERRHRESLECIRAASAPAPAPTTSGAKGSTTRPTRPGANTVYSNRAPPTPP